MHVKALLKVFLFQAPLTPILPFVVEPEEEYVELITDGRVRFSVGGQEHWFGAGACFWHRPGEETVYRSDPQAPYECLVLRFRVAKRMRHLPRVTVWPTPAVARAFTWEMLEAFHDPGTDREALGRYAYARVVWMSRSSSPVSPETPPVLREALAELERCLARDVSVWELARRVDCSASGLHALFQKHLGTTPHQYRLHLRLLKARQMLASSTESIKAVAQACGFVSTENFCRRFLQRVGATPGAYRIRHRIPVQTYDR